VTQSNQLHIAAGERIVELQDDLIRAVV